MTAAPAWLARDPGGHAVGLLQLHLFQVFHAETAHTAVVYDR
jgi:hypothetical protein